MCAGGDSGRTDALLCSVLLVNMILKITRLTGATYAQEVTVDAVVNQNDMIDTIAITKGRGTQVTFPILSHSTLCLRFTFVRHFAVVESC